MDFKEVSISFGKESLPFFIWGFFLMMTLEYLTFLPFKEEIQNVFFESAAIKTICVLFSMVVLAAGLYLLLFGSSEVGKWKKFIVHNTVNYPAKFGISFSAVAFGLFNGLALAALCSGHTAGAIKVLLMSLYLPLIAFVYWLATAVVADGPLKGTISGSEHWVGLIMIIASPSLLWIVLKTA